MKVPADLYSASARLYLGLPEIDYPFHDRDVLVANCARVCIYRKKIPTRSCSLDRSWD
jgi:hypothetical protein